MHVLVNIDVPDLAAAEAFYTRAFDLRVSRRFGNAGVELLGGNAPVYLLEKPAGSTGAGITPRDYARHWTPLHCDVVVDDLDAALARALPASTRRPPRTRCRLKSMVPGCLRWACRRPTSCATTGRRSRC